MPRKLATMPSVTQNCQLLPAMVWARKKVTLWPISGPAMCNITKVRAIMRSASLFRIAAGMNQSMKLQRLLYMVPPSVGHLVHDDV